MSSVLVTGGLGYIGRHVIVKLIENDYDVIILDNLSNSTLSTLDDLNEITNKKIPFYNIDLTNQSAVESLFIKEKITHVMHFAALKSVDDSFNKPFFYYFNNVGGTKILLETMQKYSCYNLIFSSSASVYGNKDRLVKEEDELDCLSPYAKTKMLCEQLIEDVCRETNGFKACALRYFNPIGSHPSGKLNNKPTKENANLIEHILKVVNGHSDLISIYGNDYQTKDGTPVRDFIHIEDLADGHIAALLNLKEGFSVYNLGSGNPYYVLEIIKQMQLIVGKEIPFDYKSRRSGDIGFSLADISKAKRELSWNPKLDLSEMCLSTLNHK